MSATMTKKRQEVTAQRMPADEPKEKRYSPPQCSACTELRKQKGKENANYTEIYGHAIVQGIKIRYCRCKFCGHTWKVIS